MAILFVTTTNDKIFVDYAKVCLKEFDLMAGEDIEMINYVESGSNKIFDESFKKIKNIILNSTKHQKFLKYFSNIYEAQGFKIHMVNEKGKKFLAIKPDFRFNAIKFSYKVFAMYEAYKYSIDKNFKYLIWTDADVRFKRKFLVQDLEEFLPSKNELMSYLGRSKFPTPAKPYSETGFLAFNIHHPNFDNLINDIINTYVSGEIFSFEQWHDCWVFDRVRERYEKDNFKFKNLSGNFHHLSHPYVNTNLGIYFDHFKGDSRKIKLKSHDTDYKNI